MGGAAEAAPPIYNPRRLPASKRTADRRADSCTTEHAARATTSCRPRGSAEPQRNPPTKRNPPSLFADLLPDQLATELAQAGNRTGNGSTLARPALCRRNACSVLFLGYAENP